MIDRILERGDQLSAFLNSGRPLPVGIGRKCREVIESPYRVIYRVESDEIVILAVVHSSRRLRQALLR